MPTEGYGDGTGRSPATVSGFTQDRSSIRIGSDVPAEAQYAAAVLRDLLERCGRAEHGVTPEAALRSFAAVAAAALDASSALVALRERRKGVVQLVPLVRIGRYETALRDILPLEGTLAGRALSDDGGKPGSPDLASDEDASVIERSLRIGPFCARPLRVGGRAVGLLCLGRDRGAAEFEGQDFQVLDGYLGIGSEMLAILVEPDTDPATEEAAQRELMHHLRHAVNNPLAVIMGQAQILLRDPSIAADPYLSQSIEAVFEAGERIRTVLRGLTAADESAGS